MSRRSIFVVLTSCLLVARAAAQPDVPDGFTLESVVLDPFDGAPIGFAFLPDGRRLVIEKDTGNVRLAMPGTTSSVVILTIPLLTIDSERGLLGVAVDPNWPARPYVYFHSTRIGNVIHITMYTASGDLTNPGSTNVVLGNPYVLLNDLPDGSNVHNGGTLRFGPDGLLYVSLGEDSRRCEAQNLAFALGKILRLDVSAMPGIGTGPPPKADITPVENPYTGGEWQRLVFARGLRNPFRFTVDPQTGNLYIGDVGHATWEEVNELNMMQDGGANFGWPQFEGPVENPIGGAPGCSTPPFVSAIALYPNPVVGVAAIVCGPRYRTDAHAPYAFPRAYDGDVFFADFYEGWIRRIHFDAGTWSVADSVAGQPSATSWAGNLGQIVDLQQGPDGALYVLSFINGGVARGLHRIVNTLPSDVAAETAGAFRVRSVPNPARLGSGARFECTLGRSNAARVRVFDAAGRLVRTLVPAPAASGDLVWDGRHTDGTPAAAGLYVYEFESQRGERAHGKILLAR